MTASMTTSTDKVKKLQERFQTLLKNVKKDPPHGAPALPSLKLTPRPSRSRPTPSYAP